MSATIKDVAKLANVSISTVSRVINDSKPVSPEVRKRVQDAIKELEYKPNEVARSLVTKKSNLIGLIVDDIGNSYVAQIIRGIEEVGRMYNYDIVLCSSYGVDSTETKFAHLLMRKQVEGIIIVSEILNSEVIDQVKEYKIPFVYLNRHYNIVETPTVSIDDSKASNMMTEYLISLGHKNILYITKEKDIDLSVEKDKIKGYKEAMKSIDGQIRILGVKDYSIDEGYCIGSTVMKLHKEEGITAIFCCKDDVAIGLINYFYDQDMKVPEDISIVGYGDTKLASIYRPKLTTIKEPYYDFGAVAIRKIIKELNKEIIEKQTIYLPIQLIKRKSCNRI